MKYLSLFSGIGGFELGIQQAYVEIINREKNGESQADSSKNEKERNRLVAKKRETTATKRRHDGELSDWSDDPRAPYCVGYSEIDKYAIQIYQKHFPNHKAYGDITKINETELPDFELLCGGFPCQSFSIAGKRGGFNDTRGTMFFHIARILKAKRPRLLLLENVKGLLSHDKGKTFATIISTLDELGYDLQWQVLNSKNFGVPQNRERVFIVGHLRGTARPKVFPLTEDGKSTDELSRHIANTITRRYEGAQATGTYIGEGKFNAQETKPSGQSLFKERSVTDDSDGIRRQTHSTSIRRLTPTECMRLQGFSDDWCDGISDTQKYKCAGNAVTVNVIREIVNKLSTVTN